MAEGRELRDGAKFDGEKLRLDLLPLDALMEIGLIYTKGARKYEDRNWEKGIKYMRIVGALLRHLFKWVCGQEFDEEGNRHSAAIAWNAIALVTYEIRGMTQFDDRPCKKEIFDNGKEEEWRAVGQVNGIQYQERF